VESHLYPVKEGQRLPKTCVMKFKDFQAPVLFSSTFKALNLGEKNSSTFKDFQGCVGTLDTRVHTATLKSIAVASVRSKSYGVESCARCASCIKRARGSGDVF